MRRVSDEARAAEAKRQAADSRYKLKQFMLRMASRSSRRKATGLPPATPTQSQQTQPAQPSQPAAQPATSDVSRSSLKSMFALAAELGIDLFPAQPGRSPHTAAGAGGSVAGSVADGAVDDDASSRPDTGKKPRIDLFVSYTFLMILVYIACPFVDTVHRISCAYNINKENENG